MKENHPNNSPISKSFAQKMETISPFELKNRLIEMADESIALLVPVFTPYIEIPELRRYEFDVTEISATQMTSDGRHTWQYSDAGIDK